MHWFELGKKKKKGKKKEKLFRQSTAPKKKTKANHRTKWSKNKWRQRPFTPLTTGLCRNHRQFMGVEKSPGQAPKPQKPTPRKKKIGFQRRPTVHRWLRPSTKGGGKPQWKKSRRVWDRFRFVAREGSFVFHGLGVFRECSLLFFAKAPGPATEAYTPQIIQAAPPQGPPFFLKLHGDGPVVCTAPAVPGPFAFLFVFAFRQRRPFYPRTVGLPFLNISNATGLRSFAGFTEFSPVYVEAPPCGHQTGRVHLSAERFKIVTVG